MSLKEFQVIMKLGEGTYSSVYKVKRLADDCEYALKRVKLGNLSEKEKLNALNQVRILASIRHPNIIGYKQAFLDPATNSLCIVMEFADNGDLYQRILQQQKKNEHFKEAEIWSVFLQVVKGLKALHELRIMHRDLKSANVFLTKEGVAKLGDMNVSKVLRRGMCETQTGTPYYASPEVWKDLPYDSKSDIWSLGCVVYEMASLKPPFRAQDMQGLFKKVTRGFYSKIPSQYSQDLSNVLRSLLQVDPVIRPSCDKIMSLAVVARNASKGQFFESDELIPQLLRTINIPKNMTYLTQKLPKANYIPLKYRVASVNARSLASSLQKASDVYNLSQMTSLPDIKKQTESKAQSIQKLLRKKRNQRGKKSHSQKKRLGLQVEGKTCDSQQRVKHHRRQKQERECEETLILPQLKRYMVYNNSPSKPIKRSDSNPRK